MAPGYKMEATINIQTYIPALLKLLEDSDGDMVLDVLGLLSALTEDIEEAQGLFASSGGFATMKSLLKNAADNSTRESVLDVVRGLFDSPSMRLEIATAEYVPVLGKVVDEGTPKMQQIAATILRALGTCSETASQVVGTPAYNSALSILQVMEP